MLLLTLTHWAAAIIVDNPGMDRLAPMPAESRDSLTYFPGTLDTAKARAVTVG